MKPDYGMELVLIGTDKNVPLFFFGVPFLRVDFLAPNSYSTMLEQQMDGIDYALSFDFNDDIFAFIVSKIPSNLHNNFSKCLIGKSFPFSVN